jgi:hypothetical protein
MLLHVRQDMGVGVERQADAAMPEHFTHDFDMDALAQQECGRCMPKVMKPAVWQSGFSEQGSKRPIQQIASVYWFANFVGEHQVKVMPDRAKLEPFSGLAAPMSSEGFYSAWGEGDTAS